jgi:hypothetical protein
MERIVTKNLVRQGDILFIPISKVVASFTLHPVKNGIIAEGEATGHHHRVAEADLEKAEVYAISTGEVRYLTVLDGKISIQHEEHGTVELEPGSYEIHRARQYDYGQHVARQVAD